MPIEGGLWFNITIELVRKLLGLIVFWRTEVGNDHDEWIELPSTR